MQKVKNEAEKYKDYFRSQIETLRNEMIQKKSNIDKMKLLLEHYFLDKNFTEAKNPESKCPDLEKELFSLNEKFSKRSKDERSKWKDYMDK